MKKLIFKEIRLISLKEQAAKHIRFAPDVNIIHGQNKNNTGKSSLIKSIYNTLGADVNFHRDWKKAKVISMLTFSLDKKNYTLLRQDKMYALFSSQLEIIGKWNKINDHFAPALAKLLDYKFTLTDRLEKRLVPPPAYFFLPFYIDQDKSWLQSWNSFENLGQFARWQETTKQYHMGILNDEYFEISRLISEMQNKQKILKKNTDSLRFALDKYKDLLQEASMFNLDIELFQQDMEKLSNEIIVIQRLENELKAILFDLYDEKSLLEQQHFAIKKKLLGLAVEFDSNINTCITCGNTSQKLFEDRLKTAENEARCYELLNEVEYKLQIVIEQIEKKNREYKEKVKEKVQIENLLTKKNGEINFEDVIKQHGQQQFRKKIETDLSKETEELYITEKILEELSQRKKQLTSKEKKDKIMASYLEYMKDFLMKLNVKKIKEEDYTNLRTNINEKGSDQPRALLAYYYSLLHIISAESNSTFCPIVIDSPNQQDQSTKNYNKMLDVIIKEKPKDSQLILGVVDEPPAALKGKRIKLKDEYKLLTTDEFDDVFEFSKVLFNQLNE